MNLFCGASQPASNSASMFVMSPMPRVCVATPESVGDNAWYLDSGSTHHLTNSSSTMEHETSYIGLGKVYLGNGSSLLVLCSGQSSLLTHARPLYMKSLLLVLGITKNLLSISKFTKDNQGVFEFSPTSY